MNNSQMPLISDAVQEKLYCKWIDQDDDKYHNAIARAQRDADMAQIPAIRKEAVKEFAAELEKTMPSTLITIVSGYDAPQYKEIVIAHIRAMAGKE